MPCTWGLTRARSLMRREGWEDKRAVHAVCVIERVQDLSRVACVFVSTTRMLAMPAASRSRSVASVQARMQSAMPMLPNACEVSHMSWGVCGAWYKQGCSACWPCAKHTFLTTDVLCNCRPMCPAHVSLRVRDLSRRGGGTTSMPCTPSACLNACEISHA